MNFIGLGDGSTWFRYCEARACLYYERAIKAPGAIAAGLFTLAGAVFAAAPSRTR